MTVLYADVPKTGVNTVEWFETEGDAEGALFAVDFALHQVKPPYHAVNAEVEEVASVPSNPKRLWRIRFDIREGELS